MRKEFETWIAKIFDNNLLSKTNGIYNDNYIQTLWLLTKLSLIYHKKYCKHEGAYLANDDNTCCKCGLPVG